MRHEPHLQFIRAFVIGWKSGRYWRAHQQRILPEDNQMNPFSNFMAGIVPHIGWRMGYAYAFTQVAKPAHSSWWVWEDRYQSLYGIKPYWLSESKLICDKAQSRVGSWGSRKCERPS